MVLFTFHMIDAGVTYTVHTPVFILSFTKVVSKCLWNYQMSLDANHLIKWKQMLYTIATVDMNAKAVCVLKSQNIHSIQWHTG